MSAFSWPLCICSIVYSIVSFNRKIKATLSTNVCNLYNYALSGIENIFNKIINGKDRDGNKTIRKVKNDSAGHHDGFKTTWRECAEIGAVQFDQSAAI